MYIKEMSREAMLSFLKEVDESFPVPLSHKQDLEDLTEKFVEKATICAKIENNEICSMVIGYTNNVVIDMAYISVVASRQEYQGRGMAVRLVREFSEIAFSEGLTAVHLYSDSRNEVAIRIYEKVGFERYVVSNELRPKDVHLILRLNNSWEEQ